MVVFKDVLAAAKAEVSEIDGATAGERVAKGAQLIDVREPDETAAGIVGGSLRIPRGMLELQIEAAVPDLSLIHISEPTRPY